MVLSSRTCLVRSARKILVFSQFQSYYKYNHINHHTHFLSCISQVSDPVQHSEGVNKYTSYRVDVRPQNSDMATTQVFSAVLRRYSDFLWLYEKLQMERAGAIVPPLPEKHPVGRFNPAFVEIRRRELERFLRRAAVHPELQGCASLDAFLQGDDVTFQAAKNSKNTNGLMMHQSGMMGMANSMMMPPKSQSSPTKKEGFKRWFAETKTSISGDLVSNSITHIRVLIFA